MGTQELLDRADAISADLSDEASVDLRSFVATYRSKREDADARGSVAYARAVVRRADAEGLTVEPEHVATRDELRAEIKARNEARDAASKIKPASQSRDDLAAALDADDALQRG